MDLYQIMDEDAWSARLRRLAEELQIALALCDKDGKILEHYGDPCPLCQVADQKEQLLELICPQDNQSLLARARETLAPVTDLCEVGLLRLFVPIVRRRALVGMISGCSLVDRVRDKDLASVAEQFQISEEVLRPIIGSTQLRTDEEIRSLAEEIFRQLNG
jgi:ligand-binding sensor protein